MFLYLNEPEILRKVLEEGYFDPLNLTKLIKILIKDSIIKGNSKKDCYEIVKQYITEHNKEFDETSFKNMITRLINNSWNKKDELKLTNITEVSYTAKELNNIKDLNRPIPELYAFCMLTYAKISNLIRNKNDGWITINLEEMFNYVSKFYPNKVKKTTHKLLNLRVVYLAGLFKVSNSIGKNSFQILFIDNDEKESKKNIELTVNINDDDEDILKNYLTWRKKKNTLDL